MTFHPQASTRISKLIGLSALLSITPLAAQLKIDFSRPGGSLEPDYQIYEAEHEVNNSGTDPLADLPGLGQFVIPAANLTKRQAIFVVEEQAP